MKKNISRILIIVGIFLIIWGLVDYFDSKRVTKVIDNKTELVVTDESSQNYSVLTMGVGLLLTLSGFIFIKKK